MQDRLLPACLPELPSDDRLFYIRHSSPDLSELQSATFIVTTPCWFSESVKGNLHKMDPSWLFSHSSIGLRMNSQTLVPDQWNSTVVL